MNRESWPFDPEDLGLVLTSWSVSQGEWLVCYRFTPLVWVVTICRWMDGEEA